MRWAYRSGPGFFSSFRKGGVQLNMLAVGVVLIGTVMTVLGSYGLGHIAAGYGGHSLWCYY